MTWAQMQLDVIDERIAGAATVTQHPATMQSRDTTGPGGTAIFDGSTRSVPVKVPGSVHAFAGDRVGLAQFGSDWIVVYCFTRWGESFNSFRADLSSGSRATNSFADMPGSPSFTLRKRYDDSRLVVTMVTGMFANVTAESDFAMQLDDGTTATDHQLFTVHVAGAANVHATGAGGDTFTGLSAGLWTLTARWRTNTGTMNTGTSDTIYMSAREIGPLHP